MAEAPPPPYPQRGIPKSGMFANHPPRWQIQQAFEAGFGHVADAQKERYVRDKRDRIGGYAGLDPSSDTRSDFDRNPEASLDENRKMRRVGEMSSREAKRQRQLRPILGNVISPKMNLEPYENWVRRRSPYGPPSEPPINRYDPAPRDERGEDVFDLRLRAKAYESLKNRLLAMLQKYGVNLWLKDYNPDDLLEAVEGYCNELRLLLVYQEIRLGNIYPCTQLAARIRDFNGNVIRIIQDYEQMLRTYNDESQYYRTEVRRLDSQLQSAKRKILWLVQKFRSDSYLEEHDINAFNPIMDDIECDATDSERQIQQLRYELMVAQERNRELMTALAVAHQQRVVVDGQAVVVDVVREDFGQLVEEAINESLEKLRGLQGAEEEGQFQDARAQDETQEGEPEEQKCEEEDGEHERQEREEENGDPERRENEEQEDEPERQGRQEQEGEPERRESEEQEGEPERRESEEQEGEPERRESEEQEGEPERRESEEQEGEPEEHERQPQESEPERPAREEQQSESERPESEHQEGEPKSLGVESEVQESGREGWEIERVHQESQEEPQRLPGATGREQVQEEQETSPSNWDTSEDIVLQSFESVKFREKEKLKQLSREIGDLYKEKMEKETYLVKLATTLSYLKSKTDHYEGQVKTQEKAMKEALAKLNNPQLGPSASPAQIHQPGPRGASSQKPQPSLRASPAQRHRQYRGPQPAEKAKSGKKRKPPGRFQPSPADHSHQYTSAAQTIPGMAFGQPGAGAAKFTQTSSQSQDERLRRGALGETSSSPTRHPTRGTQRGLLDVILGHEGTIPSAILSSFPMYQKLSTSQGYLFDENANLLTDDNVFLDNEALHVSPQSSANGMAPDRQRCSVPRRQLLFEILRLQGAPASAMTPAVPGNKELSTSQGELVNVSGNELLFSEEEMSPERVSPQTGFSGNIIQNRPYRAKAFREIFIIPANKKRKKSLAINVDINARPSFSGRNDVICDMKLNMTEPIVLKRSMNRQKFRRRIP